MIRDMLSGPISRMRFVRRYSGVPVLFPENLAEHVAAVSMYCFHIGVWVEETHEVIFWDRLMAFALMHDVEEAITGDIPRAAKLVSDQAKQACKDLAREAAWSMGPSTYNTWMQSKDPTMIEGKIVIFADYLAVLGFLTQELRAGNAATIDYEVLNNYADSFQDPRYDFIRPLIEESRGVIQELNLAKQS